MYRVRVFRNKSRNEGVDAGVGFFAAGFLVGGAARSKATGCCFCISEAGRGSGGTVLRLNTVHPRRLAMTTAPAIQYQRRDAPSDTGIGMVSGSASFAPLSEDKRSLSPTS